MAEDSGPQKAEGWTLDRLRLRLELYRLMAAVFASHEYTLSQHDERVGMTLAHLSWQFETGEIENGLVAVASMTRVLLDEASPRPPQARASCGTLTQAASPGARSRVLTVREACNKILHATSREYETDGPTMLPVMHLHGRQFDVKWHATVELLPLAARIAELTTAVEK